MREGIRSNDIHMSTTHEEADVIMVQQLFTAITTKKLEKVQIICDDTDVFVLLLYFYWKLQIEADVLMEATSGNRNIIDIKQSVCKNKDIVQSLLAAHAVSGCDTIGRYHGIGKWTFFKYLRVSLKLCHLGKLGSDFNLVQNECTLLVSSCYGFPSESVTDMQNKNMVFQNR